MSISNTRPPPRGRSGSASTEDLARSLIEIRNLPDSPLAGDTRPSQVCTALRAAHARGAPVLELLQLSAMRTLSLSVGSTTIRQYLSGLRSYTTFINCLSEISGNTIETFPVDSTVIVSWISTFRNGRTAANYVSHLRKWALLLGKDASELNSPLIATALKGQLSEHPGGNRRMRAIQLTLLRRLIPESKPNHNGDSPPDDPASSAFVLAYWFLLRIPSELLPLSKTNITINVDHSVVIRLQKRKNVNKPVTLIRFCVCSTIGAKLCPHTHATRLMHRSSSDRSLLPKMSAEGLRALLRQRLVNLGLSDPQQFGLHSFRRGHATDLSEQEVAPSVLLRMGGWRSAAFQVYLNLPDIHARAASRFVVDESSDEE